MKGKTLTVPCKMLASAFIIREPAVHPDFAAELPVNEMITVLAFGELSVGEASPFHIILQTRQAKEDIQSALKKKRGRSHVLIQLYQFWNSLHSAYDSATSQRNQ
jgi:hypothetical protein